MKRIKHFFAPCTELLSWAELKSTFLFSIAAAQQALRLFISHLWWLFPVVVVMYFALSQTTAEAQRAAVLFLSKYNFFDASGIELPPPVSVPSLIISTLIANLCAYFFSFVALLLMRPSREAKDWNYLVTGLNEYFVPALVLFPAYLLLSGVGFIASIWAFAMLFFMDGGASFDSLTKALSRGFWAYLRFFPAVVLVSGGSFIILALLSFLLVLVSQSLVTLIFGSMFLGQLLLGAAAIVFLFFVAPMVFFHLAVINTMYVKILGKYRYLFFEEAK
jgi:hypothetical protein